MSEAQPDSKATMRSSPECEPGHDIAAVLAAACQGDQGAWRTLVGLYGRRLFALAKSRVGSQDVAEEITQSVFVTLATKLRQEGAGYQEQGKFESWLFRIAMNRLRDEVRRIRRHAEPTDPEQFQHVPGPAIQDGGGLKSDEMRRLRWAMSKLADADREIMELRHHGGMSFAGIADLLGEPLGTLLARHHRALRKLKDMLVADDGRMQDAEDEP